MDTVIRTSTLRAPRLMRRSPAWATYTVNGICLVTVLVLIFSLRTGSPTVRLGDVAGEEVVAQRQAVYQDHAATAAARQRAAAGIAPRYTFDPTAAEHRTAQATTFLNRVGQILAAAAPGTQKESAILRIVPPGVPSGALQQFPLLSPDAFGFVESRALALLQQAEVWRFAASDGPSTELGLLSTVSPSATHAQRLAIGDVLSAFITPTLLLNRSATDRLRRQAAAQVRPVMVTIYPGEVIVRRGDIVTSSVMQKLAALGLHQRQVTWHDVAGSLLFAAVVVAMLTWYLHSFHPGILENLRLLGLVDACILAAVTGARLFTFGHILLPFFLPIAAASTFAAVLIAPEACIAVALGMAVLAGWVVANSFELTMYYFLSGTAGVLAIRQVRQIKQFIIAGLFITAFALATVLAFAIVDQNYDFAAFREYALAAAFNGFVSSTLALGGFVLLSSFFGVTTALQLLELAQPSQPLLRRIMVKAPGTYNHSLILSTMVERAADDVGANVLVAKVGALYHDVGKVTNPHAFVENQLGMGNIHDELEPAQSARIIRGHVPQGLRLGRQHKLPHIILDAIAEHHGTTTLAFFLHRAQQQADGMPIDIAVYQYPGPKPQSKETGLIMLADACESAVRASPDRSFDRINEIVAQIFNERIQQEQLDECPLTLKDLERSRAAFCAVLNGLYHPRIEYPEPTDTVDAGLARVHAP